MNAVRVIARLDIKGPNLVKGIHLEGLRVMGKPEKFAKYYYETGADELMYMDAVASLYERNSLDDIISRTAREIFVPLTVGGGIRTIEDMKRVLRAGADKISINTAAIKTPDLIQKASRIFGSSTIVVAIETIKQDNGDYLCYTDNGREYTGRDALEWAVEVEKLGAGEICLTSVDREGTGVGYDLDLVQKISSSVSIPVIAHGGAGSVGDCADVIQNGNADAIAVASMLHYDYVVHARDLEGYEDEGNIEFLKSGRDFTRINTAGLAEIKQTLNDNNIICRL